MPASSLCGWWPLLSWVGEGHSGEGLLCALASPLGDRPLPSSKFGAPQKDLFLSPGSFLLVIILIFYGLIFIQHKSNEKCSKVSFVRPHGAPEVFKGTEPSIGANPRLTWCQ